MDGQQTALLLSVYVDLTTVVQPPVSTLSPSQTLTNVPDGPAVSGAFAAAMQAANTCVMVGAGKQSGLAVDQSVPLDTQGFEPQRFIAQNLIAPGTNAQNPDSPKTAPSNSIDPGQPMNAVANVSLAVRAAFSDGTVNATQAPVDGDAGHDSPAQEPSPVQAAGTSPQGERVAATSTAGTEAVVPRPAHGGFDAATVSGALHVHAAPPPRCDSKAPLQADSEADSPGATVNTKGASQPVDPPAQKVPQTVPQTPTHGPAPARSIAPLQATAPAAGSEVPAADAAHPQEDIQADTQPLRATPHGSLPVHATGLRARATAHHGAAGTPSAMEAKVLPAAVEPALPTNASTLPQILPANGCVPAGKDAHSPGKDGLVATESVPQGMGVGTPGANSVKGEAVDSSRLAAANSSGAAPLKARITAAEPAEDDKTAEPMWTGTSAFGEHVLQSNGKAALTPEAGNGVSFSHSMGSGGATSPGTVTHADVHAAVQGSRVSNTDSVTQLNTQPVRRLDVAIDDPTLGVLTVRAELRNGSLHASLGGVTEGMSNAAPALQQFLQEHRVGVHTVSFSEGSHGADRAPSSAAATGDASMSFAGNRGSTSEREPAQSPRRVPSVRSSDEVPLAEVMKRSIPSTYQAAGYAFKGSSSSTVSIHI